MLNQICGLIERGHEVEIVARWKEDGPVHEDVSKYGLDQKTRYWPAMPGASTLTAVKAAGLLLTHGWQAPLRFVSCLNEPRFGYHARSFEMLYSAVPALNAGADFDVIHSHFAPAGIMAAKLREAGILAGKLVVTFHDVGMTTYVQKWGRAFFEHLFSNGDLFMTTSEKSRLQLIDMGAPAERTAVHRMGVDFNRFTLTDCTPAHDRPVRLLSVGRLVEKKGFEYGIRAVAELRDQGISCQYDIVGGGELSAELHHLCRELSVEELVVFRGARTHDEIARYLAEADILLAPSVVAENGEEEVIPLTIMEALACGIPVVSTYHASIPELVHDEKNGFLVAERDVPALAQRIETLIHDEGTRLKLGRQARKTAESMSNVELLNDQLIRRFEHLCAERYDSAVNLERPA
ncbi:MAG: glycosyltransferase [Planctomycetota bacterium]